MMIEFKLMENNTLRPFRSNQKICRLNSHLKSLNNPFAARINKDLLG